MSDVFDLELAHPRRNALNGELLAWLDARLDEAADRPILLRGSEGCFCAGVDLRWVVEASPEEVEGFLRRLDAVAARLFLHPAPVVAALDGHAIAGGCVLALCADHRVASARDDARIGLNEVALGAHFPARILQLCAHRIPARFRELVLLGADLVGPSEALRRGLVDEVADDALGLARTRLDALARHPRPAYAATKRALREPVVAAGTAAEDAVLAAALPAWTGVDLRGRVERLFGAARGGA